MQIQVENSQFSASPCFQSEQQRLNAFSALQFITIPDGLASLIISANQPSVEQQDALWLQTDEFTNPIQPFRFSSQYAQWVWPHNIPANDPRRFLYAGDSGDIDALDGGNSNAVTATDGPLWEIDSEWSDKLPIGAGTVADVNENVNEFDDSAPDYPSLRGIFFIKRTARQFLTPS